jgi:hypothetical protein
MTLEMSKRNGASGVSRGDDGYFWTEGVGITGVSLGKRGAGSESWHRRNQIGVDITGTLCARMALAPAVG